MGLLWNYTSLQTPCLSHGSLTVFLVSQYYSRFCTMFHIFFSSLHQILVFSSGMLIFPSSGIVSSNAAVPSAQNSHQSSFEILNWILLPTSWEMSKISSGLQDHPLTPGRCRPSSEPWLKEYRLYSVLIVILSPGTLDREQAPQESAEALHPRRNLNPVH